MTVKERKPKSTTPAPTVEQIQERKTRERLTSYRALVARAASGEQLPEADLEEAADLLDRLGLPSYTFRRDVAAQQSFAAATADDARLTAAEPGNADRLKAIDARLKAIDEELKTLRVERYDIAQTQQLQRVALDRRMTELVFNHPQVFADLEQAVAARLKVKNTPPPTPSAQPATSADPRIGWIH